MSETAEKSFKGKTSVGTLRIIYAVSSNGTVQRVYPKAKPDQHA